MIDETKLKEEILVELDGDRLLPHEKDQVADELVSLADSRIRLAVLDQMTEEQRAKLIRVADSGSASEVREYIAAIIPDLESFGWDIAREAISEFRELRKKAA